MRNLLAGTWALAIGLAGLVGCTTGTPPPVSTGALPVQAIATSSGTPQSHAIEGSFAEPLVAMVTTNGTPTAGVVVTFTAPANGASVTFANSATTATATTNSSGLATSPALVANATAGSYSVMASASGVPTPATFNLSNTAGAPEAILASSGNSQSAPISSAFALPLIAVVVDGGQNPVSNAMVVFTAPASGASGIFADTGTNTTSAATNLVGIATSAPFTANAISGADSVTASVGGVSTPAIFNLTNLSGMPTAIEATSGTPQFATVLTAFSSPLVATVTDSSSNPVAGAAVTFAAPATSGSPSGTFANGKNAETDTTNPSGVATSTTFTANAVTGGPYTVAATVAGSLTPANFSLTNTAASNTFVFYLMGQEAIGPNFYALAGSVKIDSNGNVLIGEQDYNDGSSFMSPEPSGDRITGGSLTVDSTGQGTISLTTNNASLGVGGVETLGVQFVNSNHAQIIQFDGTATSNGSLDLQTLPTSLSGGFAFTLTGVDYPNYNPVGFGGVFSIIGGTTLQNGSIDTNDAGTVVIGTPLSGTVSKPDSLGRGTISGFSNPVTASSIALNYYIVGPEVLRLIDVDQINAVITTNDSAVGSAFGQGTNAAGATNASLGNSVLGVAGSPYLYNYTVAGMFATDSSSATFSGVADDNELSFFVQVPDTPISGTYSVANNGYGNFTIPAGTLGDVSVLGLYLTDPKLNLTDPNNTTTGIGGGLVADMDPVSTSTGAILSGGVGVLIPSDTSALSPETYAFGAQGINADCCEFDFVGVGSVKTGVFNGTGLLSDPFLTFGISTTNSGVTFAGAPQADTNNPGRFTMLSTNTVPNPLNITFGGVTTPFDVVLYHATGGQFLWLNEDFISQFLGILQIQGSLTGLPISAAPPTKTGKKRTASLRRDHERFLQR